MELSKIWLYILMATLIIALMFILTIFITEVQVIISIADRTEQAVIAAGWAGFSEVEVPIIADREISFDIRDLSLDKPVAAATTRRFIIENLKLNPDLTARTESFIADKSRPVIIEEITVFNPVDLPAIASNGKRIDRTTIHVVLEIPLQIRVVGAVYGRTNVFVDIDTFVN